MSTNYYARLNFGGRYSAETTVSMHIGKTSSGVTFSGDWFSSAAAWREFLEFNADKVQIRSESGVDMTVDEFFEYVEGYSKEQRRTQFDWITENSPERLSEYWLDAEGYTFSKGEFF